MKLRYHKLQNIKLHPQSWYLIAYYHWFYSFVWLYHQMHLLQLSCLQAFVMTSSSLSMKFLKDLGFDKPSWLPNFGGDKKEGDDTTAAEDATVNADEKAASEGEPVAAKEE